MAPITGTTTGTSDERVLQNPLTWESPECHKNPVERCVDLGHVFRCPRHPERFCQDRNGKTCVSCVEAKRRFNKVQERETRDVREAEAAAALATRAETVAAAGNGWNDKLPTVNKLAKPAANKEQALRTNKRRDFNNEKRPKPYKAANVHQKEQTETDKGSKLGQDATKGTSKLRIRRERWNPPEMVSPLPLPISHLTLAVSKESWSITSLVSVLRLVSDNDDMSWHV